MDSEQAVPLTLERVQEALSVTVTDLPGLRDRAVLLVGFFGALRRSELSALTVEDLAFEAGGVVVRIRRGKRNQDHAEFVGLPRLRGQDCPVAALETWLTAAAITTGPVFRGVNKAGRVGHRTLQPEGVNRRVKDLVARAGLAHPERYSAHSLRAGFVTSAKARGWPEDRIMRHTRHRSVAVMRSYDRPELSWQDNPAAALT